MAKIDYNVPTAVTTPDGTGKLLVYQGKYYSFPNPQVWHGYSKLNESLGMSATIQITSEELGGLKSGGTVGQEFTTSYEELRQAGEAAQRQSLTGQTVDQLKRELAGLISEIDEKLSALPLSLTDEELETFLNKAIEQVKPYYEKKKSEIEKSIETGKIRSAEDVLSEIRKVREEAGILLQKYDVEKAETEEELIDTLSRITSKTAEDLAFKKDDWRVRVDDAKKGQVQKQILTSGIGRKEIGELLARQGMEETEIQRQGEYLTGEAERKANYDLQTIGLARQSVEQERIRKIGTPEQEAATTASALERAGLTGLGQLASQEELARQRGEEPYLQYAPEALTELSEEQKRAIESRKLTLQEEELAIRQASYEAEKKRILAQAAKEHSNLSDYIYGSYSAAI